MTNAEREAPARREVVTLLRVGANVCAYSADAIGNGLSPQQARAATLDAASALADLSGQLRRLARSATEGQYRKIPYCPGGQPGLDAAGRRALALELAASGLSQRQIAARVGRSERRVWDYLRGR